MHGESLLIQTAWYVKHFNSERTGRKTLPVLFTTYSYEQALMILGDGVRGLFLKMTL